MPLKRKSTSALEFKFKKNCKYIGSMAITLLNGEERQKHVNEKLLEMKDVGKGIPVIILVTEEGVKILKSDESAVKMAHGITKIAFSTSQPEKRLFAYIAKTHTSTGTVFTQAHMFKTKKSQHTQELSSAISRAFKIAYAKNTTKRANQVNKFEKEAQERKEDVNIDRKRWAKSEMARGHENSGHALRALRFSQESSHDVSADLKRLVEDIETTTSIDTQVKSVDVFSSPSVAEDVFNEPSGAKDVLSESIVGNDDEVVKNTTNGGVSNCTDISTANPQQYNKRPRKNRPTSTDLADPKLSIQENTNEFDRENDSKEDYINQISDCLEDSKIKTSNECTDNLEDWDIIPLNADFPQKLAVPIPRFGTLLDEETVRMKEIVDMEKMVSLTMDAENNTEGECDRKDEKDPDTKEVTITEKQDAKIDISRITMSEKQILNDAEWYQLGFSRHIAESILRNRTVGSFFIRDSQSTPGCFVMTMKVPVSIKQNGFMNFLIENLPDECLRIKGFQSKFPSLLMLVAYYSSVDDELPCRLHLANSNPLFFTGDHTSSQTKDETTENADQEDFGEDDSDEGEDPDYINLCSNEEIMKELSRLEDDLDE